MNGDATKDDDGLFTKGTVECRAPAGPARANLLRPSSWLLHFLALRCEPAILAAISLSTSDNSLIVADPRFTYLRVYVERMGVHWTDCITRRINRNVRVCDCRLFMGRGERPVYQCSSAPVSAILGYKVVKVKPESHLSRFKLRY